MSSFTVDSYSPDVRVSEKVLNTAGKCDNSNIRKKVKNISEENKVFLTKLEIDENIQPIENINNGT